MLILSRRENDRIVFPALGITVEVRKLTRSRASIGIEAPKGIRVIRQELLDEADEGDFAESATEALTAAVRQQLVSVIKDEIKVATEKLKAAQADLKAGQTEDALESLGQTLANLDGLLAEEFTPTSCDRNSVSNDWMPVSDVVAETETAYQTTSAGRTPESDLRVFVVDDPQDQSVAAHLSQYGIHFQCRDEELVAVCDRLRPEKTQIVLLSTIADDDSGNRFTGICRVGQVPVIATSDDFNHEDVPVTAG